LLIVLVDYPEHVLGFIVLAFATLLPIAGVGMLIVLVDYPEHVMGFIVLATLVLI
jgi:hypothetical protein